MEARRRSVSDPLAGSPWSSRETVAGFAASAPNATLMHFAGQELHRVGGGRIVDIGCGAGRNAIPLARQGWNIIGLDLSLPMIHAAAERTVRERVEPRARFALASMDSLPVRDRSCNLVVAHGIWNLCPSTDTFRRAIGRSSSIRAPPCVSIRNESMPATSRFHQAAASPPPAGSRTPSVFATGGRALGLRRDTLDLLAAPATPPTHGFYDECMKTDGIQFSLGFMKSTPAWPFGSARSFGSPGAGGSLGFADPEAGIGYAYVTSQMGTALTGDPRDIALREALYSTLRLSPRPEVSHRAPGGTGGDREPTPEEHHVSTV